ncbi:hypothetical protein LP418_17310 [Nocardioides sp. B-3]|nr:hypothetical protein [Nocardioides sp. B-3]UUZ58057.1 hypothetical protein LP418_17310 [Nocardioides sp. B-3]
MDAAGQRRQAVAAPAVGCRDPGAVQEVGGLADPEVLPGRGGALGGLEEARAGQERHHLDVPRQAPLGHADARSGHPRHRQPAEPRGLPQGRRAARDPGAVEPGRGERAVGRGRDLCRRGALAPECRALRPVRHQPLPGLRRLRRRAPERDDRDQGDGPSGPVLRRTARVHPVLREQRRLDGGRLDALPRGQGGPLRRLGRQQERDPDVRRGRRDAGAALPDDRRPHLDRGRDPRRQRRGGADGCRR